MDESDGVFAKRRRNLLIAGVIILIIVILNPMLDKITLFGIEFKFKGKNWLIWLGLTFWFLYVFYRVYTFFNTKIRSTFNKNRNWFIYWLEGGDEYWKGILEKYRIELVNNNSLNIPLGKAKVGYDQSTLDYLQQNVLNNKIPFTQTVRFDIIEGGENSRKKEEIEISFELTPQMKRKFRQRKIRYLFHEDWSEYSFILLFAFVVFVAIGYKWIMIIAQLM